MEKKERQIKIPEQKYREFQRAIKRQKKAKLLLEMLWNIFKGVKTN